MEITQNIKDLANKEWRMSNFYKIENLENSELITFTMKPEQKYLFDLLEKAKESKNPHQIKEEILKARQLGITTFFVVYMFDDVIFNANYKTRLIAHEDNIAKDIFKKVKLMWEYFPMREQFEKSKSIICNNTDEISFVSNSSMQIGIKARGGTYNHVHVTELGKMSKMYPGRADEIFTGALPTVIQNNGLFTIESTAEGVGGHFYELWNGAPDNGFNKHFFPWFKEPKYEFEPRNDIPERFLKIQSRYNLSDRKISWYYTKYLEFKRSSGDDNKVSSGDLLFQEYPSCPEEAFLQSGRPVFDMSTVRRCVCDNPKSGYHYGAGIDTATGEGSDYSVLTIVCKETGDQVFTYRSKERIPEFAKKAVDFCYMYNGALLNIETNGVGTAMKLAVEDQGYRNLYLDKKGFDKISTIMTDRVGTTTSRQTKILMIQNVKTLFEDGYLKISDEKTYTELASYQFNQRMAMEAPSGGNDDCVMALALAVRTLDELKIGHPLTENHKSFLMKKRRTHQRMTTADKIRAGIY